MNLRKPIFLKRCFLLLSGMILLTACGRDDSASLSEQLDYMIRNKRLFDEKKEERIDIFRRMLHVTSLTPEQEYALNDSLSEVFYKYRLDSAIRYGERNLELARRIGDRNRSASAAPASKPGSCSTRSAGNFPAVSSNPTTRPTFSFTTATRSSPAPAGRRTTGRFTAIRSGDTSESRPATPKPASRPSNGCWNGSDKSRPGPPSMPRRPIPWATTTGRTATTGWRKNTTPSRRSPTSKTPRRKTARSSPWRNSTSITRIIRGPTNTPSRPSRTPFAATCSSGSCG